MMKIHFMTSQKPSSPSSSFEVDILSLSSDSSTGSMASPSVSSKKRASSSKQKASKKPRPLASGSLSPADMQRFWGLEQKHRYDNFKSLPIVPSRVVNLSQLKDSHCPWIVWWISRFTPAVINATYDSRTFSSMGYVQVENKWVKKDSIKERAETSKPTKISADSAALLLQDNDELKTRLLGVERGLETLHDAVEKVFRLQKDTTTDVGKLRIAMTRIKQEGISTVNKFTHQVDSLKGGFSFSNNDFAVSVQTYYSSLSRGMERSYNTLYGKVINTLKYFLGDH
ncbi:hypothetical protein KY289_008265 [Solanum tuberosum]|nr:hypothetical protein KY289_008265 [Solanum tuberosum]